MSTESRNPINNDIEAQKRAEQLQSIATLASQRTRRYVAPDKDSDDERMAHIAWNDKDQFFYPRSSRIIVESVRVPEGDDPKRTDLRIVNETYGRGHRAHYWDGMYLYSRLKVNTDGAVEDVGNMDNGTITFERGISDSPFHIDEENLRNWPLRRLLASAGLGEIHDELAKMGYPAASIQVLLDKGEIKTVAIRDNSTEESQLLVSMEYEEGQMGSL